MITRKSVGRNPRRPPTREESAASTLGLIENVFEPFQRFLPPEITRKCIMACPKASNCKHQKWHQQLTPPALKLGLHREGHQEIWFDLVFCRAQKTERHDACRYQSRIVSNEEHGAWLLIIRSAICQLHCNELELRKFSASDKIRMIKILRTV